MKVQIIVSSTREGRATHQVAKWVENTARGNESIDWEVVDLRDYDIPFFAEPISPKYNPDRTPEPVVQKWLDKIAEADAYVIVTPEYSRTIPAVLKNALDHTAFQFEKKPAAIVAHGSIGGTRSIDHLRVIGAELGMAVIPKAVSIVGLVAMGGIIDENGELSEELKANPYGPQAGLASLLRDLIWYGEALKVARVSA